jgi:DUF1680 family protein
MISPKLILAAFCLAAPLAIADDAPAPAPSAPVPPAVTFFDLDDVQLLDGPFKVAQQTDLAYLLKLEPDRLLAWYRKEAGLKPKAEVYGGWESLGVAGHTLGHYLSAISQMYAATGNPELLTRVNYIVADLAECQKANGNGYLAAMPKGKIIFARIKQGDFGPVEPLSQLDGAWVPWYTIHKEMAGLLDAYVYCHNAQALDVAAHLGDWTGGIVQGLSHDKMQEMLKAEQGGITESLANLSALTGNKAYLDLAIKFRHDAVFLPLAHGRDELTDLHANTQIPKMTGYQRVYELTGDAEWNTAAQNFWNNVTGNRIFVTGGNSEHEKFFAPEKFEEQMNDITGPESCNTYNMLKLTEHLFEYHPEGALMDFYERALYNHILCTIRPGQDGFVYYTSMSPGSYHTYSTDFNDFWCCVGTGMENHTRYGKAIYAHVGVDKLLVNLFIPSELTWKELGLTVTQTGDFPTQPRSQMVFKLAKPKTFTVSVRDPGWTSSAMALSVNGAPQTVTAKPGQYADITREWKDGDTLTVETPMALRTEMLPHSTDYVAVLYGPVVLAGKLGDEGLDAATVNRVDMDEKKRLTPEKTPIFVAPVADIASHLQRAQDGSLTFASHDLVKPGDVSLVPLYQIVNERYSVYWQLVDHDTWQKEQDAIAAAAQVERDFAARTIDSVQPQDKQPEADHHLASETSSSGRYSDTGWRDASKGGWFSYTLTTAKDQPMQLVCKYLGGETGDRQFDIVVDGTVIATEKLGDRKPRIFYQVAYPIPDALTKGKSSITVRFQAKPGNTAGGLFDCRLVRANG